VRRLAAGRGGNGRGGRRHGADGRTVEIRVPVGTQLLDPEGALVADLVVPEARYVAARGGAGGRGNARFATPTRQTPRFAETGLPGEEADLVIRLKLVVDAALAGLPNAGKSSLLRRISNAKPKVADYPFTTVEPVLGTVEGPDARQLTIADVPGLIEGAAGGAGLGHEFLAHLERARLLLHVLDASAGDLEERFRTIDRELAAYGAGLAERPQLLVLNKVDVPGSARSFDVADPRIQGVVPASALTGEGIEELERMLFELCPPEAAAPVPAPLPEFVDYRPRPRRRPAFRILRTDRGYRVVGTPPPEDELEEALRRAGVRRGAEVEVGGETLEWG
jgi:GTP-binding protein